MKTLSATLRIEALSPSIRHSLIPLTFVDSGGDSAGISDGNQGTCSHLRIIRSLLLSGVSDVHRRALLQREDLLPLPQVLLVATLVAAAVAFDSDAAVSPLEDMQVFVDESSSAEDAAHKSTFMKALPPPSEFQGGSGTPTLGESAKWYPKYEQSGELLLEHNVLKKQEHSKKYIAKEQDAYESAHASLIHFEEGVKREIHDYEAVN